MNWMKHKWLYFTLSTLILVPGAVALIFLGLRPSIDFSGGSLLELRFDQVETFPETQAIKTVIESDGLEVSSVQQAGDQAVLIRAKPMTKDEVTQIKEAMTEAFGQVPVEVRFETVGPTLGKELLRKTLFAVVLAALGIMGYVAWQFKDKKFGACAILAMLHDSLILLGAFSLLGHFFGVEVDTLFVTAVLTVLSFSVHDTVVVYDRIRESRKHHPQVDFEVIANKAVSETLVRSINNSLTIAFMLVALLLLGGVTIRWFVVALLIGTIAGTYSSTFTAVPLLVAWEKLKRGGKK